MGSATCLVSAGVYWDAVRVPGCLGDRVLAFLGCSSGAVIEDMVSLVQYWLIAPGTADGWEAISQVQVLGPGCYVGVPPRQSTDWSVTRWLVPLEWDCYMTNADDLRAAVKAVQ
jgi:hypothetical protein